jgi:LemA protein
MQTGVWIAIAVVVVLLVAIALFLWVTYNALVTLRARVDEAWRDITVQLQHRAEVLPALSASVKPYADHEQALYDSVDAARAESLAATGPDSASAAEVHLQQALKSMYAVADAFPQLTASPEYLQLQSDLGEAGDRLQASRRFYNGGVREFNAKVQSFPSSLFARRPGFDKREFFETSDLAAKAEPPRVQF